MVAESLEKTSLRSSFTGRLEKITKLEKVEFHNPNFYSENLRFKEQSRMIMETQGEIGKGPYGIEEIFETGDEIKILIRGLDGTKKAINDHYLKKYKENN